MTQTSWYLVVLVSLKEVVQSSTLLRTPEAPSPQPSQPNAPPTLAAVQSLVLYKCFSNLVLQFIKIQPLSPPPGLLSKQAWGAAPACAVPAGSQVLRLDVLYVTGCLMHVALQMPRVGKISPFPQWGSLPQPASCVRTWTTRPSPQTFTPAGLPRSGSTPS